VPQRRPAADNPFAGTENELVTPPWRSAEFEAQARTTSLWQMFLRLPDTARYLFSLAWRQFPATVVLVLVTTGVGGLAAQGTHEDLMALGPGTRYHDLYRTQASAYTDDEFGTGRKEPQVADLG
jgi:hypothetical protein